VIDPSQVNEVARTDAPVSGEYVAGIDKSNPLRAVLVSHRGGTWQLMQDFCGGTPEQRRAWCRRMIKTLKESDKNAPRRRFH
jgi:hypothetical protein